MVVQLPIRLLPTSLFVVAPSRAISLVLVLDLTRPNELWITMEQLLAAASKDIEVASKELNQQNQDAMKALVKSRVSDYKDDIRMCSPFPIPLLIVGSKYDEFQNFDSEQRRKICATMRFIAHYYGADLIFYSARSEQLVKIGRSFLSRFAFATTVPKAKVDDHNKPLYIVCGMDSFESIGPPPVDTASFSRAGQPIHLWKQAFCDHFPQAERETADKSNEEQDIFAEPMIDNLVAKREKDLEVYIKQKKDRQAAEARAAEKIRAI
ncbi:unnamed protein product [Cylicocyclus nassatus]|uniref:Cytoplasmic dynein 2 light intermediate chain 1 n=1 Tax=Cylicocyclus nassatus TaxID=53992 RepID=A0AA36GZN4_CYLNA|nr:unnamed protein product [Cylicocyclus nassatus]